MKWIMFFAVVVIAGYIVYGFLRGSVAEAPSTSIETQDEGEASLPESAVTITPISHATMILQWGEEVIYTDPVAAAGPYGEYPQPTLMLVTDIHGDHLDVATLESLLDPETVIVAPQAVADEFTPTLFAQTIVMANGETQDVLGFSVEAIPMYNLPEQGVEIRHEAGRGNGYVLERDGERVYIAGDTAGTPEMRALADIDIAFVPMNLPYTMSVEDAADAVLAFKPVRVIPYHYRTPEGFSDVARFKEIVNVNDPTIRVDLMDWYRE